MNFRVEQLRRELPDCRLIVVAENDSASLVLFVPPEEPPRLWLIPAQPLELEMMCRC